ncbi:MAG: hypothetical protein AB8G05_18735 [Oligoflexales bacterium]
MEKQKVDSFFVDPKINEETKEKQKKSWTHKEKSTCIVTGVSSIYLLQTLNEWDGRQKQAQAQANRQIGYLD